MANAGVRGRPIEPLVLSAQAPPILKVAVMACLTRPALAALEPSTTIRWVPERGRR